MSKIPAMAATAAFLALFATPALPHAKLTSSSPAAGTTASSTNKFVLRFSEDLQPGLSGATLYRVQARVRSLDRMSHDRAVDGVSAALDPTDSKRLLMKAKAPLASGDYKIGWHSVSTDTHALTGSYRFSVK